MLQHSTATYSFSYIILLQLAAEYGSCSQGILTSPLMYFVFRPQRMQLSIILNSLQDNSHVASLLGFSPDAEASGAGGPTPATTQSDHRLAENLMKTLLRNLSFHTVRDVSTSFLFFTFIYPSILQVSR